MTNNEYVRLIGEEEILEIKKQIEREVLSQKDIIKYAKKVLALYKLNFYSDIKRNIDKDIEDLNTCVVMYDFFFNSFMNLLVIQDSEEKEALLQAMLNAQVAFDADVEKYNEERIQYEKIISALKELNVKKLQPSKKPC